MDEVVTCALSPAVCSDHFQPSPRTTHLPPSIFLALSTRLGVEQGQGPRQPLTLIHRPTQIPPTGASLLNPGPIARGVWQKVLHPEATLNTNKHTPPWPQAPLLPSLLFPMLACSPSLLATTPVKRPGPLWSAQEPIWVPLDPWPLEVCSFLGISSTTCFLTPVASPGLTPPPLTSEPWMPGLWEALFSASLLRG